MTDQQIQYELPGVRMFSQTGPWVCSRDGNLRAAVMAEDCPRVPDTFTVAWRTPGWHCR
jgi:hypothetical protein